VTGVTVAKRRAIDMYRGREVRAPLVFIQEVGLAVRHCTCIRMMVSGSKLAGLPIILIELFCGFR
jgi:hypothetical protein